jgi:hypothetical protein
MTSALLLLISVSMLNSSGVTLSTRYAGKGILSNSLYRFTPPVRDHLFPLPELYDFPEEIRSIVSFVSSDCSLPLDYIQSKQPFQFRFRTSPVVSPLGFSPPQLL